MIGCTVAEVRSLGICEYQNWIRYFRWKNNEIQTDEELAEQLARWRQ